MADHIGRSVHDVEECLGGRFGNLEEVSQELNESSIFHHIERIVDLVLVLFHGPLAGKEIEEVVVVSIQWRRQQD